MAPASTSIISSSSDDSQFLSHGEFDRFYDLQSAGIRHEFRRVSERMDTGFRSVNDRFQTVDERLQTLNDRIDRLAKNTEHRFERVDRRFDSLTLEMRHMAARFRNSALTRLHQAIHIVHAQDPEGSPIVPAHFPKNVKAFLKLRDDSKTAPTEQLKQSLIDAASSLISLCRSYDCCTWGSWHHFQSDSSMSDSDDPSSDSDCPRTLEEAVESYTEMALRDLAEVLGLDIDRLDEGLRQYKEFSRRHGRGLQKQHKRSQTFLVAIHDVKRQRPCPPKQERRPSSPRPRTADPELLKLLLRVKSSSSPKSEPSLHTQLGWAVNSAELEEHRKALRKEATAGKPEAQRDRGSRALPTRPSPEPKKSQVSSQRTDVQD